MSTSTDQLPVVDQASVIVLELTRITDEHLDEAWTLYLDAFRHLATLAVQRHVMTRPEFDEVMVDTRVLKYVAYAGPGGPLVGLATFSNVVEAMPLISPDYFAHHWPQLYRDGQVWIVGFVCSARTRAAVGVFPELVRWMWLRANGGLIVIDVCQYNVEAKFLRRGIDLIVGRIAGPDHHGRLADSQNYYIYETGEEAA